MWLIFPWLPQPCFSVIIRSFGSHSSYFPDYLLYVFLISFGLPVIIPNISLITASMFFATISLCFSVYHSFHFPMISFSMFFCYDAYHFPMITASMFLMWLIFPWLPSLCFSVIIPTIMWLIFPWLPQSCFSVFFGYHSYHFPMFFGYHSYHFLMICFSVIIPTISLWSVFRLSFLLFPYDPLFGFHSYHFPIIAVMFFCYHSFGYHS